MKIRGLVCAAVYSLGGLTLLNAQLSWQNDVVIEGDLDVGTTTQQGNLRVTGETGNQASTALNVTGDGGVLFQGTADVGQFPVINSGPYFFWYPKKLALKVGAGSVVDSAVGRSSVGIYGNASGEGSVAVKGNASGRGAFSLGGHISSGLLSFAFAEGFAYGERSMAGQGWADGDYSTALGYSSLAYGEASIAIGEGQSDGYRSTSLTRGWALGDYSIAFGGGSDPYSFAAGYASIAIGGGSVANAYASVVIGAGTADGNPTAWVDTDPQFVVGYGTGDAYGPVEKQNRNALVVYKNGNISMPKRQGDILMGEFGLPE